MSELKLGDIVRVSKGKFAGKTGHVVGISTYDNNFTDPYYEVYMYCVVPEKYKCRKPLIGNNNVIGGLSADELEVIFSAKSQQQRLIPKDNLKQILDLQEKYTTLNCECRRFADWVVNLTRDCHSVAIRFDDEYLDMAARQIAGNLRPKTAEEKEADRKMFSDAVNNAFNKTIGKELKK